MLTPQDTPDGWTVTHSPVPIEESTRLCDMLGIADDAAARARISWDRIRNDATGLAAVLAVTYAGNDRRNPYVAGVLAAYAPGEHLQPVKPSHLQQIPIAEIEARLAERQRETDEALRALRAGLTFDPASEPLGEPDGSPEFDARVGRLWEWFAEHSEHPTREIADQEGVSLRTAQRWVTSARRAGFLQPVKRGQSR